MAAFGAASLAACQHKPPEAEAGPAQASYADRHRIEVRQAGERLVLQVAPGEVALNSGMRAQVRGLADSYLRWGHGALVVSTPAGGANADAAAVIANEARMALVEAGVPYDVVTGASYDASGVDSAPLVLSFTRYEARAPDCAPLWEQDLAHQSNNRPWESFGCATQANLAAMVEDPRDLLGPRDEEPRDSGRRGTVMGAYREGDQTHAERSNDERVTISNAVQ
jgi:pilus assembly protein CpaD